MDAEGVTLRLFAIAAGAVALLLPATAQAYCVGWDKDAPNYDPRYYSVAHEFRRAKYVAIVQVRRETWIGDNAKPKPLRPPFQDGHSRPWGFDPYVGAFYDVDVVEPFKGAPPKRLRLFSENTTARFWLDPGKRYLFFIFEDKFNEPVGRQLTIDTCGNSDLLAKRPKTLKLVRNLARSPR